VFVEFGFVYVSFFATVVRWLENKNPLSFAETEVRAQALRFYTHIVTS